MARLDGWKSRAQQAAASLKAEYEAGKRGDESPTAPIWATPQEQVNNLLTLFRSILPTAQDETTPRNEPNTTATDRQADVASPDDPPNHPIDDPATDTSPDTVEDDHADASAVADALRRVDWAGVRAATSERTGDAAKAMKAMADQVDWARVQPLAAQVSSALIAAVATGQIGVGGRLGSMVARTITNQGGLGQRVAAELEGAPASAPAEFRNTIAAISREV